MNLGLRNTQPSAISGLVANRRFRSRRSASTTHRGIFSIVGRVRASARPGPLAWQAVRMKNVFPMTICLLLAACTVGPTVPKGQLTIQGRGAEALTNGGDPLLSNGIEARKVPVEFAKGYTKGISDQVKRGYWARQDAQKSDPDVQGRIRYYDATLPEREDADGVVRVQRRVVIPIVE
jgi:hypothetical protein